MNSGESGRGRFSLALPHFTRVTLKERKVTPMLVMDAAVNFLPAGCGLTAANDTPVPGGW